VTDTAPDIERRYRQMMLSQSPSRRVAMACRMFATAKALIRAGIRQPDEGLSPAGWRRYLFLRLYGGDFDEAEREKILSHLQAEE
jgi:hypothetical protein